MSTFIVGSIASLIYLCGFIYLCLRLTDPGLRRGMLLIAGGVGALFHAIATYQLIFTAAGFDFSLLRVSSAIFLVINIIVLTSSIRKPVHSLLLFLFPLSALELIFALTMDSTIRPHTDLTPEIGFHILISIVAYSLLTFAMLQALLLAYQNRRLHNKHPGGVLKTLPPLQTMETLLFEVVWSGFILLSLSLLTGFLFHEDILAQHLLHKAVFSCLAWIIYAILLWGRHRKGWRGNQAIRWLGVGFIAMVLAYWGSQVVLELILERGY